MYITKSDYLLFKQCPKSFWMRKHKREVFSDVSQLKMDKGNEVTEVARKLFSGGMLVEYNEDVMEMVKKTEELIISGQKVLYEAAFEHDGLVVICDIIKQEQEGWDVYEVKSSSGVKERHIDDVSFQYYVLNKTLEIKDISLVCINTDYSRGKELDIKRLFKSELQTEKAKTKQEEINVEITSMKRILTEECPNVEIGSYCDKYSKDKFPCGAKKYCWSHVPEYSIFDIARIGKKAFELYHEGIVELDKVPEHYKLSKNQQFQVKAYKESVSIFDKNSIEKYLEGFTFPLYFIDFETFQQAIPLFEGVTPYQQIPFQYSLHVLKENGELEHKEFLGIEGQNPKYELAKRLIKDIPKNVCSVAYNMSFEKKVIKTLAEEFPEFEKHLMDIHDNMVDLMVPFQKKWYFTNEMKGKYSIKNVLPALISDDKGLNYKALNIQNGTMAMEIFERLHTYSADEIKKIRKDLLAYCHLDTLAMVKIWEHLYKKIKK